MRDGGEEERDDAAEGGALGDQVRQVGGHDDEHDLVDVGVEGDVVRLAGGARLCGRRQLEALEHKRAGERHTHACALTCNVFNIQDDVSKFFLVD